MINHDDRDCGCVRHYIDSISGSGSARAYARTVCQLMRSHQEKSIVEALKHIAAVLLQHAVPNHFGLQSILVVRLSDDCLPVRAVSLSIVVSSSCLIAV